MSSSSLSLAKSILRPRIGRFLPTVKILPHLALKDWSFSHVGFRVSLIDPNDEQLRKKAKEYMIHKFYKEAPVPVALKLVDSQGPPGLADFLEREMNIFLDSGASCKFEREGAGADEPLSGIGLSAVWPKDPNHEIIEGIHVRDWLNAAAELAVERELESGVDRRITYRDLQYQHIYNLAQLALRAYPQKEAIHWAAMMGVAKEVRSSNMSVALVTNFVRKVHESNPAIMLSCQSNFPPFDKVVIDNYHRARMLEEAKYGEVDMEIKGVKVFHKFAHLDSMKFFIDEPDQL